MESLLLIVALCQQPSWTQLRSPTAAAQPAAQPQTGRSWSSVRTTDDVRQQVQVPSQPRNTSLTLVEFTAEWCSPCRSMVPIVSELERSGTKVRRVNFDTETEIVKRFKVGVIPTFVAMDGAGNEVGRIVGVANAAKLRSLLRL